MKEQKPAATCTLSNKMKKAVDEHNSKESGPLTMAAIRAANNLVSTDELATSLGLNYLTDCLLYHLLGSCPGCNCQHKLNPTFNEGQAICLIKKATKA